MPAIVSMQGRTWVQLSDQEKMARTANTRERKRIARLNANMHSLRCDMELKLKIAQDFENYPELFFPHNMDFRGRVYPLHPHLNHMGSDMCRGLLRFAKSRPLGENGINWLKIHLGNLYGGGVDKLALEDREKWAEDNIHDIKVCHGGGSCLEDTDTYTECVCRILRKTHLLRCFGEMRSRLSNFSALPWS